MSRKVIVKGFQDLTIAVAGTGYVGLSIPVLFAQNHKVFAVYILNSKVDMINQRKSPIQDEYIENFFTEKELYLLATLDAEMAYSVADFVIIATSTFDSTTQHFDISAIENVIDFVMEYNPNAVMVIKSTIPVGYTESVRKRTDSHNSPKFLRESNALHDNGWPKKLVG